MASIAKILGGRTTVEPLHTKYELLGFLILAYLRKIMSKTFGGRAQFYELLGFRYCLGGLVTFKARALAQPRTGEAPLLNTLGGLFETSL